MKTLLMVAAHTAQCDLATQLIEHGADVYHHVVN